MNEFEIIQALNEIDDDLIEKANPKRSKQKYFKLIPVAACFVIICTAINFYQNPKPSAPPTGTPVDAIRESTTQTVGENATEIVVIPEGTKVDSATEVLGKEEFEKYPFYSKYGILRFNSKKYSVQYGGDCDKKYIDKKIANATVESFYEVESEIMKAEISVYKIKGISTDCAVAVKDEKADKYYYYADQRFKFKSLNDMEKKLKLKTNMTFSYARYDDRKASVTNYLNLNSDKIMEILFDNSNAKAVNDPGIKTHFDFELNVVIPCLSSQKDVHWICISEDGYLRFHIFDDYKFFFIGKEKAQDIIEYVKNNHKSEKKFYITQTDKHEQLVTEVISQAAQRPKS